MNCNELMIGDWVHYKRIEGYYVQVRYIYARLLPDGTTPANEVGWTHDESQWVHGSWLQGIPLTEDILRANEWKVKTSNSNIGFLRDLRHWHPKRLENRFSIIAMSNGSFGIVFMDRLYSIRFVHELQHTLRLFGFTDIATNFKIK